MSSLKDEVLEEFASIPNAIRPGYVSDQNKPVVGYFCSFVPPELLLSAGLYPMRLNGLGVEDSSSGDALMSHLTCSFARHIVARVLDQKYDYLSGQISVNTCDHVRRANDALVARSDLRFHGFISVPRSLRESLLPWYIEELNRLKFSIEEHFNVKITDHALGESIDLMNQVRKRIKTLDLVRREDPPKLSGADMLNVTVCARILFPTEFIKLADSLIESLKDSEPISGIRARLLVTGGPLDDSRFIRVIESQGAHIAGDLVCFGTRGLGLMVEKGRDPLSSIASSYLNQIPCARMMGEFPKRYEALLELYKDCKASGIIFQRIKFCQLWSVDVHNLRHRFEETPLPMLVLDREYGIVSTGQIKTRVQAFLERLGA